MASIHIERLIDRPAEAVWDAIRDVGALHDRLVPGFVVDTRLEDEARVVTFANGMVARELLIALDDDRRRFAYSVLSEQLAHHNATNEVFEAGPGRSRFVWKADVLPHAAAETVRGMMEQGADALKAAMER
ncbi:SRPBCC family protein [Caulobacter mirabilis]|uniref:MxaD family protein n=1 Tax=Caulobacter mirabilis TaxID=69666 RepID=A0A2D2AXY4_9CAUL|nr:SRPBCC family protein [Caulobacter mirabilis]ATQ42878.1 MxaD family protein [Caulobacter mirabilis]